MPRPSARAESERRSHRKLFDKQWLRLRVVTQHKFFSLPVCDRPGCFVSPVSSARNPARYCCPTCRQAVRAAQDRERKWLSRGTLDGRTKRAYEYQAARQRRLAQRCDTGTTTSSRPPPRC
jgi:hypothetical protein